MKGPDDLKTKIIENKLLVKRSPNWDNDCANSTNY